jgi:uncharacterized membrane protein YcaP (DUF421 family)
LEPKDLGALQVCLRAWVIFLCALCISRLADRRFLAKLAAFDVILALLLASTLSRAINGSAPLVPTICAGLLLVLTHRCFASLAFHLPWFSRLIKGRSRVLVRDARADWATLKAFKVTENDLLEEIRLQGGVERVEQVKLATFERSGTISVVRASK